jgi:hypothetical protein
MIDLDTDLPRQRLLLRVVGNVPGEEALSLGERMKAAAQVFDGPFDLIADVSGAVGPVPLKEIKAVMLAMKQHGLRHVVRVVGSAFDVAATLAQVASTVPGYSHFEARTLEDAERLLDTAGSRPPAPPSQF